MLVNGSAPPAPARAVCGGETERGTIGTNRFSWYLMWVRDPVKYAKLRKSDDYAAEVNKFLSSNFGTTF
jgi:hypothetical protein